MANIFKTKEMYKNIAPNTRITPLRKVRGVYVTGPYRPPHYIDHTLTIMSIGSTPATIVSYTETSSTIADPRENQMCVHGATFINIQQSTGFNITKFIKRNEDLYPDYGTAILNIKQSTPFSILKYNSLDEDLYPDYGTAILNINQSAPFQITKPISPNYVDIPPGETLLNILNLSSTQASINAIT